jgi:hypothetical protein
MGVNVPPETIDFVFKMADVSKDKLISYNEFYRLFDTIIKGSNQGSVNYVFYILI